MISNEAKLVDHCPKTPPSREPGSFDDEARNHCTRHFPVQNVARATYREILERQAQENGVDFVEGVATALTPMAFFETAIVRRCVLLSRNRCGARSLKLEELEELEQHPEALDVGTDSFADDDAYDPTEFIDDDEF